jgi:hypothetical protein
VVPATIPEQNDSSGAAERVIEITVSGRVYQLGADTFTQWQVREVVADVVSRTGQPHDQVSADVIAAYVDALAAVGSALLTGDLMEAVA